MEQRLDDYRVIIMPGLSDSGPDHWQSRWQARNPHFERVYQDDWETPDLDTWAASLDRCVGDSTQPVLVVAHSFGCLTTVFRSSIGPHQIAAALLVAPADPEKFGVSGRLRDVRVDFPSLVVGSSNDPWMKSRNAQAWAQRWGSDFVHAGALGHINAESKLGDWPQGWALLESLCDRLSPVV